MKKIAKYIDSQFKDLTRNLSSYSKDREAERLHEIRVDVKKLKAIINLITEHNKNFKAHKHFKPLRDIFRKAGDIRQPQIMFQLLLKYGVTGIEKDVVLDVDGALVGNFVDRVPSFIRTCKKSRKSLLKHVKTIGHRKISNSINKFKKRLQQALTSKIKFEKIHKTRKLLKQVIYLSDIHHDLKKKKRKFFNDLQELIGNVHDKQMLMILLRKSARPVNQKALEDLRLAIETDKMEIVSRCAAFYKVNDITIV